MKRKETYFYLSFATMNSRKRIKFCLCCTCGIPGSGKSSICEQLYLHLKKNYVVITLDFDKILLDSSSDSAQLRKSFRDSGQSEMNGGSMLKSARGQVLRVVEFLIQMMMTDLNLWLNNPTKPDYINEDIWHGVMTVCLDNLKACDLEETYQVLFLIDDNMYFRSMRYEYYKIAKLYGTGFCEIFVKSSVERAKERNRIRHGRDCVDDDIIERMSLKLEIPDSSKNSWERFNTTIDMDVSVDLTNVIQCIQEAFANPAHHSSVVDTEQRLQSQTICSANLIHQADLILRKCVSKTMMKGKENSEDLKSLLKKSQFVKDKILSLMKSGEMSIPEIMDTSDVKDSSKDENSEMFRYVENIYECNL